MDSSEMEFTSFGKIPRLRREVVITEKIDGTNAAVHVEPAEYGVGAGDTTDTGGFVIFDEASGNLLEVTAQSRKRVITPDTDNHGFARWVWKNATELAQTLGVGCHFGEWWGSGIQRRYGRSDKSFSLFNTSRWSDVEDVRWAVEGLGVVPVLARGVLSDDLVDSTLNHLRIYGSQLLEAPGYPNPEGVVIFHTQSRNVYKVLLEGDEYPKSLSS